MKLRRKFYENSAACSKLVKKFHFFLKSFLKVDQKDPVFKDIDDFVNHFCEDTTKARSIRKILVAANGIAAVKFMDSLKKFLMQHFGNEKLINFVCLTTDQEIPSEYLKMADHIIFSPAGANTHNYTNVDEIVEQATRNNVDAVWTGCSFASENSQLPEELNKRNIVFIGPPSKALFVLSDKIASTIIAQTVKIPTIAWSGSGLIIESTEGKEKGGGGNELEISKELYLKACISTAEEGLLSMKEKNITYPVMIKSSKGCNGKGTRKCISDEEFRLNFTNVKEEVPEAPIFLMK
ncbi:unnamed protein product [Meloidogyne enterolobii]|uniref:Uncharacterized protein n=1 Tax=Meloidogyne enterolobii TaxID=390850 RepID=A0ACB1B5A0_MELEN